MKREPGTLNSVCLLIVDCLHATAPFLDEGYPLIRTPNIGNGRFDLKDVQRVTQETYEAWTRRAIPQNDDLILAREAPAGNVAIIKRDEKVCLGQRTVLIRPDPKKVDADFLCYFLLAPKQQGFLLSGATGATAPHVNMKDIRRLPLHDLPKIEVQRKLGNVLAAYDDLIENNQRRMSLLEDGARQIYAEWFVRMRYPGQARKRRATTLPKGWTNRPLGEVCAEVRDTAAPDECEPDSPYIGLEHIPRRSISLHEWGCAAQVTSTKHRFRAGDILFGRIRPYFHKVGVTFVDGVASSDAIVLRPTASELHSLALLTVSSDTFVADASQTSREGSKMPRADWKLMKTRPVAIPTDALLCAFNAQIEPIVAQLKTLTFQTRKLRSARDLLLPRLMSGEITA